MEIKIHTLEEHDFAKLAKTERDARARTRLYILNMYKHGKTSKEIAQSLSVNIETAKRTRRRYFQTGLACLRDETRSGRKSKLDPKDIEDFKDLIVQEQASRGGGRLIAEDIRQLAKEHYQVDYSLSGTYKLLKRIGMSWVSVRSCHPKRDEEKQEDFKKTL